MKFCLFVCLFVSLFLCFFVSFVCCLFLLVSWFLCRQLRRLGGLDLHLSKMGVIRELELHYDLPLKEFVCLFVCLCVCVLD